MTTIQAFSKRHPVLTYFAFTFVLSWGSILMMAGPGVILGTRKIADVLLPFVYLAMLVGPSIAGLLLTGLVDGRLGLRALLSRLLRWRVGARWYAVALLITPLLATVVCLVLSLFSPAFFPNIVKSLTIPL